MTAAPTDALQSAPNGPHPLQRPGVVAFLQLMSVLVGIAAAGAAVVFAGIASVLAQCTDQATGLCTNYAGLVPVLEWAIVIVAGAAPLAGGIVASVRREWPWLLVGLVIAAAMTKLAFAVSTGQSGLS